LKINSKGRIEGLTKDISRNMDVYRYKNDDKYINFDVQTYKIEL